MKQLVGSDVGSYVFRPDVQQIGFLDMPRILEQEQILLITNVTDNVILYSFADATKGGTLVNNLLTLEYSTATMDAGDALQIWIDLPVPDEYAPSQDPNLFNDYINPQFTYDVNLEHIFGQNSVVDSGYIQTETKYFDTYVRDRLTIIGDAVGIDCKGLSSVAVQISGTWTGTVTFEATVDGGTYQTIYGIAPNAASLVVSTTANGIWRFNTTGHTRFRARVSAAMTGTALVTLASSGEQGLVALQNPVSGSQAQPLSQKASSYEQYTYDTNLAAVLGTTGLTRPIADPAITAPAAPTIPTTYVSNAFSKLPQIYPRMRVEAAGDQKQPFAQQPATNELKVVNDTEARILDAIYMQLVVLTNGLAAAGIINVPDSYKVFR